MQPSRQFSSPRLKQITAQTRGFAGCFIAPALRSISGWRLLAVIRQKGIPDALDDRYLAVDLVVSRDGQFLHSWRVHSHIARAGGDRGPGASHPGQKSGVKELQRIQMM